MNLIIVGAGTVGARLAKICCEHGHGVVVIEPDPEAAQAVAEACDAMVLEATIVEADIMEQAGVDRADALIATTADDAQNLMAMVLGRDANVASLVSVVNEKSHRQLFERFEVRVLQEPEDLLARHLLKLAERVIDQHE